MLEKRIIVPAAVIWVVAVVAAVAARIAWLATPVSSAEYAAWVFLGGGPLVVAMIVARSAGSETIAQVLYDAEHQAPREPR